MISWATMGLWDSIIILDNFISGKNWNKTANHVHTYKDCQKCSFQTQHYANSNLRIPIVLMVYTAMDLLGKYSETSWGHHYALTIICKLTSFVEVIPIEDKKTEAIIIAYLKYVYTDKGGSKFILTDRGGEFSSEVMSYIADHLGFTKVYTSPYSLKSNSIIERCHSFLKNTIRKMRCNHNAEWDELIHIAKMAYNIFSHSAAGGHLFFLMYRRDAYLPTLHQLLQHKMLYMGDDTCRIHLNAMREIYMMAVLNLKMSPDWYPPQTGNPQNTDLKVGDLILIKNQTPQSAFDTKYKPSYHIVKKIGEKPFDVQDPTGKIKSVCRAQNLCILQNIPWQLSHWRKSLEGLLNILTIPT